MILVLALICALDAPCTPETAIAAYPLGEARSETECAGIGPQATLARLAIQPRPGEAWRIVCQRT